MPAVKDVTFTLHRGEVHALLGENGAGKSTLTKMLAGVVAPTAGEILIDGQKVEFATPSEALKRGIAMVYQETSLVPSLTVAQNIYLTDQKRFHRLRGIYIAGQQFLQSLNFHVDPTAMVSSLGAGQKQMVEIARAVHHNAQVIIFDEPTATLTPEEKHQFFSLVERLKARGVSIIFIIARAGRSAADFRPHHRDARRPACRHRRHLRLRPGEDRARHGRPLAFGRALRIAQGQAGAPRRRQGAQRAEPLDGQRGPQHVVLGLRRPDHRRLRPDRLGPHRGGEGRGRRVEARPLPRRPGTG